MSALHYYVYYKCDPGRIGELRAVVQEVFRHVQAATKVQGQWQQRRDDPSTFMEVYADVANSTAFDQSLSGALQQSGFTALGIQRVTEIFRCA